MKRSVLFGSPILLLLFACDPGRILQVRAVAKPGYVVAVYADGTVFRADARPHHEKVALTLPGNEPLAKRDTSFLYGLGGWSDDARLKDFAGHIDSIIITRNDIPQRPISQQAIVSYLLQRRSGYMKAILRIEANDE